MNIFNLELKDNDRIILASTVKSIIHEIDSTRVNIVIPLTTLIKGLFPTYSHYLESPQASGQMKSLEFGTLLEKIAEREKVFEKKTTLPTLETMCIS